MIIRTICPNLHQPKQPESSRGASSAGFPTPCSMTASDLASIACVWAGGDRRVLRSLLYLSMDEIV